MKKIFLTSVFFVCISIFTVSVYAKEKGAILYSAGPLVEPGNNLGFRFAVNYLDSDDGIYFYSDTSIMTMMLAGVAGWEKPDGPLYKQVRYLSVRGGSTTTLFSKTQVGIDLGCDLQEMYIVNKSNEKEQAINAPVYIGLSMFQLWLHERLFTNLIPSVGLVLANEVKTDSAGNKDKGYRVRYQVDFYIFYIAAKHLALWGDLGLGYFPEGAPNGKEEPFFSPRATIGFSIINIF